MDRFSIIQKQLFDQDMVDEVIGCGHEQCECNADPVIKKLFLRKADILFLSIVPVTALLSAFVFAGKIQLGNADVLLNKRSNTISCNPGSNNAESTRKSPVDKNKESNCSHQQSLLCETHSSKRKYFKIHNC